jgi:dihydrodipicolinate synthase/N-acetylneuraminate lyase
MGEGQNLVPEQREELLEKTLVVVRGRVPVLVWISCDTEGETRATLSILEKRAQKRDYGCQILWVDTPLCYHSNRGLPSLYQSLLGQTDRPCLLYNDPELIKGLTRPFKRNNIRTSILKELVHIPGIRGLIFQGPLDRARNYHKVTLSRAEFRLYDGDESQFLNHPSLSGVVSAGANLAPRAWQRITGSSLNQGGDQKAYPDYLHQIWETGTYLRNMMDIYRTEPIPLIKQVLSDMRTIEEPTTTSENESAQDDLQRLKDIMIRYGDYMPKVS